MDNRRPDSDNRGLVCCARLDSSPPSPIVKMHSCKQGFLVEVAFTGIGRLPSAANCHPMLSIIAALPAVDEDVQSVFACSAQRGT